MLMTQLRTRLEPQRGSARDESTNSGNRLRTYVGKIAVTLTATVLGALVWQLLAVTSGGWVPPLLDVADQTVATIQSESFYADAQITLLRILIILVAATSMGVIIGLAAGLSSRVESFLRPLLVIGLAVPDPVYIIIGVLILGVGATSGVIAVVLAIAPLVANVVVGSVMNRDKTLDEMAFVYQYSWTQYLKHVLAAQILPAIAVAARTAFAYSWKLVVLMEALVASDGVGKAIYSAFQLLRPAEMVAYTIIFIVIMRVLEGLVFKPFEQRATRWSA